MQCHCRKSPKDIKLLSTKCYSCILAAIAEQMHALSILTLQIKQRICIHNSSIMPQDMPAVTYRNLPRTDNASLGLANHAAACL